MKVQKATRIGIVVSDDAFRAAQRVDGKLVTATVPIGQDAKKSLRQLLTSSPFVGRQVTLGLEGTSVLIESLVIPAGVGKSAQAVCAERLKGDPLFNEENAVQGVAVAGSPGGSGPSMVIHAAVNKQRIQMLMQTCRELELSVHAVESAALSSWRAWSGEGIQVRLVRTGRVDIVLAGYDDKLAFCRIVEKPISKVELRATVSRAASLLSSQGFGVLTTSGVPEADRQRMAADLGMEVRENEEHLVDPEAVGLATQGPVLTEFTPPEERSLRARRRARRAKLAIVAAMGPLAVTIGMLGSQRLGALEARYDQLQQQVQERNAAQAELDGLKAKYGNEQASEVVLRRTLPGHEMSHVFRLIANAAPDDLLLETITIQDVPAHEAPALESGRASGPRVLVMRMNGLGQTGDAVRRFADALLSTSAFTDVRVEASERVMLSIGQEGERFRIFARAETR